MGVKTLHLDHSSRVSSSNKQIGKSLAVVVVVIVKQELRRLNQSVCFGHNLVTGVESVPDSWDLVAEENWNRK